MNSSGMWVRATYSSMASSRPSTISAVTLVSPGVSLWLFSVAVASSAPTTNSSRWRRRTRSARMLSAMNTLAMPRAATASSVVP